MKHKFYYYEYSDDGGQTWTMGDYRRYLMPIIEQVRELSYPFRVLNQDNEQISEEEIRETIDQMNAMERILGKDSILWEAKW